MATWRHCLTQAVLLSFLLALLLIDSSHGNANYLYATAFPTTAAISYSTYLNSYLDDPKVSSRPAVCGSSAGLFAFGISEGSHVPIQSFQWLSEERR